jgi:hypothetical protein
MLVIHDEPENAPAHAAAETVKGLSVGVDVEGRRLLLVERAERSKARSGALKRKISPDHFNDIVGGGDLLNGL